MWPPDLTQGTYPRILGLSDAPSQWASDAHQKSAAVLALFIPGPHPGEPLELLFTKRSAHVRTHKGQIGFPGGRRELKDSSPVDTALREAHEEVGLAPDQVCVLGSLPLVKSLELHPVIPIVAYAPIRLTDLKASDEEVAQMFSVPWTAFTRQEQVRTRFNIFGLWRDTAVYPAGGHHIWGLTAKIITLANLIL